MNWVGGTRNRIRTQNGKRLQHVIRTLYGQRSKSLSLNENESDNAKRSRASLNKEFYRQLRYLLKILFPGIWNQSFGILTLHTATLIARTFIELDIQAFCTILDIVQLMSVHILRIIDKNNALIQNVDSLVLHDRSHVITRL
jgi:hypothetical protein